MGRTLEDVIAALPEARQRRIEARLDQLVDEVDSLGELRRVAGKAQADIAEALNIKQPSVSKIERQADMYLSTLKSYVEAMGGELDLIVRLPERAPLRIERLGDVMPAPSAAADGGGRARHPRSRSKAVKAG